MELKRMKKGVCCASLLVSFCLLTSIVSIAQTPVSLPADKIAQLEKAISSLMSGRGIPAMSVAVTQGDQIRFQGGYGTADVENYVPAKALTVYRIASTTKPLTAVAAMQLVEQGKLDLDLPIQRYFPAFPPKSSPITTRQLLAHTSGIRHYKSGEGERTDRFESLTAATAVFRDDPLDFEPGTKYGYTTFGYTLLGVVIEGASGMRFEDYMRENIFKPAGMTHTYVDDVFAIIPSRARGYRPRSYGVFNGENRNASLMDSSYKVPGGGLASTAEDLARFSIALQNGKLLKPATFAQMSVSQKTRDGRETGYGYGWYIGVSEPPTADPTAIHHGGVQAGFTAHLVLWPKKNLSVVILTNLEGGGRLGLASLASQMADIVLQ
ncbi:MAG TPA: serine hydrolase domain-containing protein [Pyrinomonadaceae bacterium]